MSEQASDRPVDPQALRQVLSQAKLHLDDAVDRVLSGAPAATLASARVRPRLADTNTSCTNTGCGGAEA